MPMLKRILLLAFSGLTLSLAQAQSYQVIVSDTVIAEEDASFLGVAHAEVKNITNSPVRTIVSRQELNVNSNHTSYFCWGVNCYAPTTSQSPDTLVLLPQQTNNTFKGYLDPSGFDGFSVVRYCFTNAQNPADQTCVVFKYLAGTAVTSVEKPGEPGQTAKVPASYDSGSQTIRVNVNGGRIEILNMLGQKMDLNFRYDGGGMIADASTLKTGYYYLFGNNERGPWSARVIVAKQ